MHTAGTALNTETTLFYQGACTACTGQNYVKNFYTKALTSGPLARFFQHAFVFIAIFYKGTNIAT